MFEASKKLINYVRLRIDEVDEGWQGTHQKTFVVLLYFPTSVSQIYPAMFFYGWDFHYLDSLDLQKSTEYTAQLKLDNCLDMSIILICTYVYRYTHY